MANNPEVLAALQGLGFPARSYKTPTGQTTLKLTRIEPSTATDEPTPPVGDANLLWARFG
jgi:hypothetical protein